MLDNRGGKQTGTALEQEQGALHTNMKAAEQAEERL